jgi:nucleotide-binding universal stress UspA family protein
MIRLNNILCPTDFSDFSLCALKYARSFAQEYEAKLHLVHVIDEAYQYWMAAGPEGVPVGPPIEELMKVAADDMSAFVKKHMSNDSNAFSSEILVGRPFLEIITYAKENEIDMIVIATHGRSGLEHLLMGSTAEKVVRKASCPVLTVRDSQHDFVMP